MLLRDGISPKVIINCFLDDPCLSLPTLPQETISILDVNTLKESVLEGGGSHLPGIAILCLCVENGAK